MLQSKDVNVQAFSSSKFGELRTQLAQDGRVWFCLNDVARALELANPRNLVQRLSKRGVHTMDGVSLTTNQYGTTTEQVVQMTYIDEPNLYRCIFQSRKKEAEKFQDWVFEEVLPAIRQNGGYIATTAEDSPEEIMAKALIVANATIAKKSEQLAHAHATIATQSEQIKADAPKVVFADALIGSSSSCLIGELAKVITQSKHFFIPILA